VREALPASIRRAFETAAEVTVAATPRTSGDNLDTRP
jgi:hypothetical protein